jgi:hypothetical protein
MSSQRVVAFADEFGNNSFQFESQGTHFIVATVIVKSGYLPELSERLNEIRLKHGFQTGEIKSSKVAGNHMRRLRILADIAKLEISIYAVVIDKKQLIGEGFNYKKSFYKFLNNLLYKELFRTFPQLELHVDEHGSNDFMREFKKYVEKNHISSLFSGAEFNIENSKQNEFIQLADFVAGTLGYVYDERKKNEFSDQFLKILANQISSINQFPRRFSFEEINESNLDQSFDAPIAKMCFLRVEQFLDKEAGTDQQKIDQINFLKLLLWLQRTSPRNRFVTTSEIFSHLNQNRPIEMQEEYFRTKVVGNLRDQGILIASGRQGYKIPTSARDLDSFIKHGKLIIMPMLHRIREAREIVRLATGNDLDLLDKIEYMEFKRLLEV